MVSDHKPLESIMKKALASAPKRLQGMMMRLQKYDINLIYVPGKNLLLADTLSRAYRPTTDGRHDDFEHVHALQYMAVTDSRLEAIRVATEADQVMTALNRSFKRVGLKRKSMHHPLFKSTSPSEMNWPYTTVSCSAANALSSQPANEVF